MPDFLFEMLIEEIPHGVLPRALTQMQELLPPLLSKYGLAPDAPAQFFASPRRLSFLLRGLPSKGASRTIEQKGPSLKAAYTAEGNPSQALEGFFKSYNVTQSDLIQKESKGQVYLFINKIEDGRPLDALLPQLMGDFVNGLKFSEPMRWNKNGAVYEFIRPVRGITALLDADILPLSFFGLQSSNMLSGHRQLFPKPLALKKASQYEEALQSIGVTPSLLQRMGSIQEQAEGLAQSLNAQAALDGELLSILACLTECPHLVLASFDKKFLQIPKEVLVSEMKVHQKYIPLFSKEGALLPNYIITANLPCGDTLTKENILRGNNRVFNARAEDGAFFYKEDLKKGLGHYRQGLAAITFVEGAGSIADKTARMQKLAGILCAQLGLSFNPESLDTALGYCKADLASLMVGEFPELQGVMGWYYAKAEGLPEDAALAIKEHYLPLGGENPTQSLSGIVGLADRLDNLCTLYAVGKTVTGSRDPYALRRQTIALIHILVQFGWDKFSLSAILDAAAPLYKGMMAQNPEDWKNLITGFVKARFEGVFRAEPYNYAADTLNAVLASGFDNILADAARAKTLHGLRLGQGAELNSLADLSKRVKNILKGAQPKELNQNLITEPAEKTLLAQITALETEFPSLNTGQAFQRLLALQPAVSAFFEAVMVKCGGDKELARMSLLHRLDTLFGRLADFTRLSLEGQ